MDGSTIAVRASRAAFSPEATQAFDVVAATVVFRVVRGELSIGLPLTTGVRGEAVRTIPTAAPQAHEADGGIDAAARQAATRAVSARELVRVSHAGVRATPSTIGAVRPRLTIVSWATARPFIAATADTAQSLEADEAFVPISALPELDAGTRSILACAFDAFLDATLADALTRRLLPRHILFRKTDGFTHSSPIESALDSAKDRGEPEIPIFVGLLPDPFPLSGCSTRRSTAAISAGSSTRSSRSGRSPPCRSSSAMSLTAPGSCSPSTRPPGRSSPSARLCEKAEKSDPVARAEESRGSPPVAEWIGLRRNSRPEVACVDGSLALLRCHRVVLWSPMRDGAGW